MVRVIVERVFAEPVTQADLDAAVERGRECFSVRGIRRVSTRASFDGRRMICEYDAPDAESVRVANDKANIPYERIWAARILPVD
jgi:hypothetical protein